MAPRPAVSYSARTPACYLSIRPLRIAHPNARTVQIWLAPEDSAAAVASVEPPAEPRRRCGEPLRTSPAAVALRDVRRFRTRVEQFGEGAARRAGRFCQRAALYRNAAE